MTLQILPTGKPGRRLLFTLILAIGAVGMITPLIWMLSSSFKFESDVFNYPIQWIPRNVTLNNYKNAFTQFPYLAWYGNTFKITVIIVGATLLVTSMAGFAFAKIDFKGRKIIFLLFIATLMIPQQIRLIPQFMLYRRLGILGTHATVILPWALFNGFAIFYMRQAFMSFPDDLIEAAVIDGSGYARIYVSVALPLVKASLVALGILAFTWGWNEYMSPLVYISEISKQMLSVGIASFRAQYATNFALQMAGSTVALIPIITVYLIAQKYLIEGISHSGIKG